MEKKVSSQTTIHEQQEAIKEKRKNEKNLFRKNM